MAEQTELPVDDTADDVRAAMAEVSSKSVEAEPLASADKPEPAESKGASERQEAKAEEKPSGERERDESGRFVAKKESGKDSETAQEKPQPAPKLQPGAQQPEQQRAADATPSPLAPPPGWSIKAKGAWDRLPNEVKEAVAKREQEVSNGFAEYSGLKPYVQMARESGTNLVNALQAYIGMEDLLRRDPAAGYFALAERLGLTQYQAGQFFADLAQRLGYQTPTQQGQLPADQAGGQLPADQNAELQRLLNPILSPLAQEINALKGHLTQQNEYSRAQNLTRAETAIEQFRSDPAHKYYDNLEDDIANLLQNGMVRRTGDTLADLKSAYEMACRLNPEVSELLINERLNQAEEAKRSAADKARNAARSVNGSPSPGASVPKKEQGGAIGSQSYNDDLEEDVRAAVRAASAMA